MLSDQCENPLFFIPDNIQFDTMFDAELDQLYDHPMIQNALAYIYQIIDKFYANPDTLERLIPHYQAKKIFQRLLHLTQNNPQPLPFNYIGQTIKCMNQIYHYPAFQAVMGLMQGQMIEYQHPEQLDLSFLQVETPFSIAQHYHGILGNVKYELLIRVIHLTFTRIEVFDKGAQCIFWTTVEIMRSKMDLDGIQPNENQQQEILTGESFESLKENVLSLIE